MVKFECINDKAKNSLVTLREDGIHFNTRELTGVYREFQQNQFVLNYESQRTLLLSSNHELVATFYLVINPIGFSNYALEKTYSKKLIDNARTYDLIIIDDPITGLEAMRKIKENNPSVICIGVGTAHAKEYLEAGALTVIDFNSANKIRALQQVAEILEKQDEIKTFRDRFPRVLLPAERGINSVAEYLTRIKESRDPYELVFTLGIYDNYAIPVMADFTAVEGVLKNTAGLKTDEVNYTDSVIDEFSCTTRKIHTFILKEQQVDTNSFNLYPHLSIRNDRPISFGFDPIPREQQGSVNYISGQSVVQFITQPPSVENYKFSEDETQRILIHANYIAICIESLIASNMPFYLHSSNIGNLYKTTMPLKEYTNMLVHKV
jgi:hypothetical protein